MEVVKNQYRSGTRKQSLSNYTGGVKTQCKFVLGGGGNEN